jgi:hypothetical protein
MQTLIAGESQIVESTGPARYVKEKRDVVLRYVKALAQALHYLTTNREGSMAIISRYARSENPEMTGAAFDAARRLYNDIPVPTTEGFDLVAKELAQRNPKLRILTRALRWTCSL